MNATEAREYLATAAATATGREAITAAGYAAIVDCPRDGDDQSSITVAAAVAAEVNRAMARYTH